MFSLMNTEVEIKIVNVETGESVKGATFQILPQKLKYKTDNNGKIIIKHLEKGQFPIQIDAPGFKTQRQVCVIDTGNLKRTFYLEPITLGMPVLEVTNSRVQSKYVEISEAANSLQGVELKEKMSNTLASTLKNETGIAIRSLGPAPARPIIRGLGGNRISMAEDGILSFDLSSTSADHSVTINPSYADKIEIIRGPKVLNYSTSAVGGVINVQEEFVPLSLPQNLHLEALQFYETSNNSYNGSFHTEFPVDSLAIKSNFTYKKGSDLQTPIGKIKHSEFENNDFNFGANYIKNNFSIGSSYRGFYTKYGIPGGFLGGHPNGATIEIQKNAFQVKSILHEHMPLLDVIEFNFQRSYFNQKEFESNNSIAAEFVVRDYIASIDFKQRTILFDDKNYLIGNYGIQSNFRNTKLGGFVFSPENQLTSFSGYFFEELSLTNFLFQFGGRATYSNFSITEKQIYPELKNRNFFDYGISLTTSYELINNLILGFNTSYSTRPPTAEDLYSKGPHIAAYTFEVGNTDLNSEKVFSIEPFISFEYHNFSIFATTFFNNFSNFIIPRNTGDTNYSILLPIYKTEGVPAWLYGYEISMKYKVITPLTADLTISYVRGLIKNSANNLPMIPPLKGNLRLLYKYENWNFSISTEFADKQMQVDKFEEPTSGYIIFNSSLMYEFAFGRTYHQISLSAENISNKIYRNHLSRIKSILPESGRNFKLLYQFYL